MNFYNEIDPYAAQWLRYLIAMGVLPNGVVDERDIRDIEPMELRQYTQCHFFAGIGGWAYALKLAGWPDDRPVWTGSCPCQPFSAAGKGGGFADERHLWPSWYHLVSVCRPEVVFGEQVASQDGLVWLDLVQGDLQASDYAVWAGDLCAAGVGAPHIRQRLWFLADADDPRSQGWVEHGLRRALERLAWAGGVAGGLAYADQQQWYGSGDGGQGGRPQPANLGSAGGLAYSDRLQPEQSARQWARPGDAESGRARGELAGQRASAAARRPGPTNGFWRDPDWLYCRDDRWRPVEPGTFPLAHGIPGRVGRLRAYGNAIVPQVAAEVIRSYLEAKADL